MSGKMEALLPCPFCGVIPELSEDLQYNLKIWDYWVKCTNNDCLVTDCCTSTYDTQSEAIAAWNRRATPAADVRGSVGAEVAGMVKRLRGTDWYGRIQNLDFAEDGDSLRRLITAASEAADLLERLAGEYVRGIEDAAKIVEQNQQTFTSIGEDEGRFLTPRKHGNRDGLAYVTAIRALAQRPKP